jgi:non-ribosomal peptide synthetase component E (peptide arylation enzyme)
LRQRYLDQAWWTDDTLGDLVARGLPAAPDAEFRVHSAVRPWSGRFAEVELTAQRLAAGLLARGVGPGDIGILDEDGYLTITDRKSDIIIRGGENISAVEVENVLLTMPGVAEAAVVSVPDDQLGS